MEISGSNYITITLFNDGHTNEIADFTDIIKKCCVEANKPGLRNMFDRGEKDLINLIMERMNLTADKPIMDVKAGDTHTHEQI